MCIQELDVLAAHLNELGLGAAGSGGASAAPFPASSSRANGKAPLPDPTSSQIAAAAALHSDSDNEEEIPATRGARNDGTLLASDPPKPLYIFQIPSLQLEYHP